MDDIENACAVQEMMLKILVILRDDVDMGRGKQF